MRNVGLIAVACAAVVGTGAWAMAGKHLSLEALTAKEQLSEMVDARTPSSAERAEAKFDQRLLAQTARETALANVGDADSFGRNVRWMGLLTHNGISLRNDCTPLPDDPADLRCMQVDSALTAPQVQEFTNLATITLPGRSLNSLLCHWASPTMSATLANDSGLDNLVARLTLQPWLTIENTVLNEPGLVDPDTGLPLNGKVDILATSNQINAVLDAGELVPQRLSASRTCLGGYLSKRSLIEFYGLSEAQATEFFRRPITVRMNARVVASHVRGGVVSYGVRFVGD